MVIYTRNPWPLRVSWMLQILLAAVFFSAGLSKLIGVPMMLELFANIGAGQWLRYLTGSIEIVSAMALLTSGAVMIGAMLLIGTMVGALFAHLVILNSNPTLALVFLMLLMTIMWLRRKTPDELSRLIVLVKI
jgi:putative oxidoreductase